MKINKENILVVQKRDDEVMNKVIGRATVRKDEFSLLQTLPRHIRL